MIINNNSKNLPVSQTTPEIIVKADGTKKRSEFSIVKEHFMDLIINGELVAKLVCTPSNLSEMIIGRLKAEGYINTIDDIETISISTHGYEANVTLKNKQNFKKTIERELTSSTGNQIFLANVNGTELQKLDTPQWKEEWIFHLAEAFVRESKIHKSTQGTHCCYLSIAGEILYSAEDIGRHNAMDKVIGYALMNHLDLSKCIIYTTGRIPTDMVKKAIGAGIPILVSKAVPTDQAIQMAAHYNLTLICRAWPDSFEVFVGTGLSVHFNPSRSSYGNLARDFG